MKQDLRFTKEHLDVFGSVSRDRNPLHSDAGYARLTPFGSPVVYGVSSVLAVLGMWAKGRSFALSSIKCQFLKPLFAGEDYAVEFSGSESKVTAKILKGEVQTTLIQFTLDGTATVAEKSAAPSSSPAFQGDICEVEYEPDPKDFRKLKEFFGLAPEQLPAHQLAALLWASYTVGEEFPGREALFSELEFRFLKENKSPGKLRLTTYRKFSASTATALTTGTGTGIERFRLAAFRRGQPIRYEMAAIAGAIGKSEELAGMTAFVSGSSRGFGSVLARALALKGATVAIHGRSLSDELKAVAADINSTGGKCVAVSGELTGEKECRQIAERVTIDVGRLDFVFNNAVPVIRPQHFLEQTGEEFLKHLSESFQIYFWPCRVFLPLLNEKGGHLFNVSSVYTKRPEKNLSHYIAAKSAMEGLALGLSRDFPQHKFYVVRPPRMLTDQTNPIVHFKEQASALDVARSFLQKILTASNATDNYFEWDI